MKIEHQNINKPARGIPARTSGEIPLGRIYLIPSSLGEEAPDSFSDSEKQLIQSLDFFIVENERSARRFLRSIGFSKNFDTVEMLKVDDDKNFLPDETLLLHFQKGKNAGVISEAGCPGIADPGAAVIRWAHHHHLKVVPLIGPSSIFLALMASGLNGQQFAFFGYLPVASVERKKKLRQLEEESKQKHQTQIFMETPYRNDALLKDILEVLKPSTQLCIASNITLAGEFIFTQAVSMWKKNIPDLKKKPTIFLLLAE